VNLHLDGSLYLSIGGKSLVFKELPQRPVKPLREKQPDLRHLGHKPVANHPWRQLHYLQEKRDISKLLERDISILV
jgi:hypothetical protein